MEETKEVLITNPTLNSMIKPNMSNSKFTMSTGQYTDAGMRLINGHLNHQQAMLFDVVYDRIYKLINEIPNSDDYVATSLKMDKDHKDENLKLLNKKKLDFFQKVNFLLKHAKENGSIPYNTVLRNDFLYAPKDIIDDAFPLEFGFSYRHELEFKAEKRGNFDEIIQLFRNYDINKHFFAYLLTMVFYGKMPHFNNHTLHIPLDSVFEDKERSVYLLKKWFMEAKNLEFAMTYPATCFLGGKLESRIKSTYMFPIERVKPFSDVHYDKSNMEISFSLRNHFMALFSHDAKMCVHKFIPSRLYKMNSNEFFLGKNLLNNVYYHSRKKVYRSKSKYCMNELLGLLNLPVKDLNHGNNTHRRKAVHKALGRLNDNRIINIDKLNSDRLLLNSVWNINKDNCIQQV